MVITKLILTRQIKTIKTALRWKSKMFIILYHAYVFVFPFSSFVVSLKNKLSTLLEPVETTPFPKILFLAQAKTVLKANPTNKTTEEQKTFRVLKH